MRSRLGLCVLGLLCLHSSVFGQEVTEVQPGVLIFCDDPSVEQAAHSAVHKFNEEMSSGHKLALYQILTASKSENGSDSVYSLQFTSRKSDCHVGSNTSWTKCNYLPYARRRPFSCNATVYMTETEADTRQVHCLLDDHINPEKAPCLGCAQEIDVNSEDLKVPVSVSISKYNTMSDSTHLFTLHEVGHATRQVVAGFRYNLRFDMKKSNCAKTEHKDLNELCVPDDQDVEFYYCNSTVDVAPWRFEAPQAEIKCEQGALPPTLFSRRRPPGFSPLRNLLYDRDVPASAAPPPPPPPPPSPAKEESSEEDTTSSKPPGSSDNSPFHCPSKPWKAFNPNSPPMAAGVPRQLPVDPDPGADMSLKDTDLLG